MSWAGSTTTTPGPGPPCSRCATRRPRVALAGLVAVSQQQPADAEVVGRLQQRRDAALRELDDADALDGELDPGQQRELRYQPGLCLALHEEPAAREERAAPVEPDVEGEASQLIDRVASAAAPREPRWPPSSRSSRRSERSGTHASTSGECVATTCWKGRFRATALSAASHVGWRLASMSSKSRIGSAVSASPSSGMASSTATSSHSAAMRRCWPAPSARAAPRSVTSGRGVSVMACTERGRSGAGPSCLASRPPACNRSARTSTNSSQVSGACGWAAPSSIERRRWPPAGCGLGLPIDGRGPPTIDRRVASS